MPVAIHAASPRQAFGGVEHVGAGVSGGLGRTAESERVVRELLEVSEQCEARSDRGAGTVYDVLQNEQE